MKKVKLLTTSAIASMFSLGTAVAAPVTGTQLGGGAAGAAGPTTSATAAQNLGAIWGNLLSSYAWIIWGVAIIWAFYEFALGDKKNTWRPLAGAAFLYVLGFIISKIATVVS